MKFENQRKIQPLKFEEFRWVKQFYWKMESYWILGNLINMIFHTKSSTAKIKQSVQYFIKLNDSMFSKIQRIKDDD